MARVTIRAVNAAIAAAGLSAELVRGRGYFYFIGADVERAPATSVLVYHLSALTVDGWLRELRDIIATVPPLSTTPATFRV